MEIVHLFRWFRRFVSAVSLYFAIWLSLSTGPGAISRLFDLEMGDRIVLARPRIFALRSFFIRRASLSWGPSTNPEESQLVRIMIGHVRGNRAE